MMYSLHGGIQNDKYIKANSYGFNPIVFYTITDHKSIIGQKIKKKSEVSYYSLLACDQNKDHNTKVWGTFSTVAHPSQCITDQMEKSAGPLNCFLI